MFYKIRTVKQMTKGIGVDENMGKVNWPFVRVISNYGYQFMPKVKGCRCGVGGSKRNVSCICISVSIDMAKLKICGKVKEIV